MSSQKRMVSLALESLQKDFGDLPAVTMEELAKHNTPTDMWVLVDNIVYDVTKFAKLHPGGAAVLQRHAGTDATADFRMVHHYAVLERPAYKRLRVGRLAIEQLEKKQQRAIVARKAKDIFVPYGDAYWEDPRGTLVAPYYEDKHRKYQLKVREFVQNEVTPYAAKWDEMGKYPLDMHKKAYAAGVYAPGYDPAYGGQPPEGGFDAFMDFLRIYELSKGNSGGFFASCLFTIYIALPPIMNHGSKWLKDKVAREIITGECIAALAVTEPWGGSDVANVRTTAVRDGDYYVVSGEKKFITSGMTAKYLTAAVRTDPSKKGMNAISLLVIDTSLPGVDRTKCDTQGWWAGNTAYITFDKVRVHKDFLVGEEHKGFKYIMENFNAERFSAIVGMATSCQMFIRESVKFARGRQTFGKPLIEAQVIRQKVALMAAKSEALFALCEQIAYMLSKKCPHADIAPRIALAKVHASQTMEFCAREASQILGGYSFQRKQGPGELVERLYREVRVMAIGAGSEEVMLDFAMRASNL